MSRERKEILCVNSIDNEGVSGLFTDIKTVEMHKIFPFGSESNIENIKTIIQKKKFKFAKITLYTNLDLEIVELLNSQNIKTIVHVVNNDLIVQNNYLTVCNEHFKLKNKLTYILNSNPFQSHTKDYFHINDKVFPIRQKGKNLSDKIGWEQVFSASLSANIVKGVPLLKSALRAKQYTAEFLNSSTGLYGYHKK